MILPYARQEIVTVEPAQLRIRYHHKIAFMVHELHSLLGAVHRLHQIAIIAQHRLKRQTHILLVIDDEHWRQGMAHGWSFIKVLVGNSTTNVAPFPSSDSIQTLPP